MNTIEGVSKIQFPSSNPREISLLLRNWNFADSLNSLYINCITSGDAKTNKLLGFYIFCYKRYNDSIMNNVKKVFMHAFQSNLKEKNRSDRLPNLAN